MRAEGALILQLASTLQPLVVQMALKRAKRDPNNPKIAIFPKKYNCLQRLANMDPDLLVIYLIISSISFLNTKTKDISQAKKF